jgi:hypothetical protein
MWGRRQGAGSLCTTESVAVEATPLAKPQPFGHLKFARLRRILQLMSTQFAKAGRLGNQRPNPSLQRTAFGSR